MVKKDFEDQERREARPLLERLCLPTLFTSLYLLI
jgi:hypothetical protein